LSASAECRRILGNQAPSAKVGPLLEVIRPDERESVRRAVEKTAAGGPPCSFECSLIRPDGGEVVVHVSGEAVLDDTGNPVRLLGTIQDITEQRRLRDALREKDVLLLQQNRLAAMGEMINYIGHQWRQPLNTISLLVQSMRDDFEHGIFDGDYLDRMVRHITDLVSHMSCTINDFRDFFKTERQAERFDLKEITCKTFSFIAESMKANRVKIDLQADETLAIEGYPNEYAHVLLNVLNNAREALVEREVRSPEIVVRIFREGDRAVVTVTDNAGGIPQDLLERVFDYSFTTKANGSGIGLYMSKTIIERRMKGSITVENVSGGTMFRMELGMGPGPAGEHADAPDMKRSA
jgi:PAS domain S-box-containing protein